MQLVIIDIEVIITVANIVTDMAMDTVMDEEGIKLVNMKSQCLIIITTRKMDKEMIPKAEIFRVLICRRPNSLLIFSGKLHLVSRTR